jgi:hypothetical protein
VSELEELFGVTRSTVYRLHHRDLVHAVARAVNATPELIEDACQNAWTILLRRQPDRVSVFGWLYVGIDWAWLSIDGAMGKARWEAGRRGPNPTDRGKLGVKRSVMVEAAGIPIGLAVDGANRNDCKLAEPTIGSIPIERPEPTPEAPQGVCLDKA